MARNWNENQGRQSLNRNRSMGGRKHQQGFENRNVRDQEEESYSQRYGADRDFINTSEFDSEYSADSDRTQGEERFDRDDKYGGYRAQQNRGNQRNDRDRSMNRDFETYGSGRNQPRPPDYKKDNGMNQGQGFSYNRSPYEGSFNDYHEDERYGRNMPDGFDRNFSGSRRDRVLDGYSDYNREPSYKGMGQDRSSRNFRGLGPKSYQKSDERLKDDICEVLMDHSEIDASDIDIEVSKGEVTLTGTVNDRWMKYHAEEVIEDLSFVNSVQNNIRVTKQKNNMQTKSSEEDSLNVSTSDKVKKSGTTDKKNMSRH